MTTAINGYVDYSNLNGICGANAYDNYSLNLNSTPIFSAYGGYYGTDIEGAKQNLQNSYEYSTLTQNYANKQNVQNQSWQYSCKNIQDLAYEGKIDEALGEYNRLIKEMKKAEQYEGYTDRQMKDVVRNLYTNTLGTAIEDDLKANASGSFVQGLKEGVPIIGTLFANGNSKDDAEAKVKGTKKTLGSTVAKATGALVSGIGGGALAGAAVGAVGGPIGAVGGAIIGGVLAVGKLIFD